MKRSTALRSEFFNRRDEEDVHGRAQLWRQAQRLRHFDGASLVGRTAAELRSLKRNAMSTVTPSVAARLSSTEPRVAVATYRAPRRPAIRKGSPYITGRPQSFVKKQLKLLCLTHPFH